MATTKQAVRVHAHANGWTVTDSKARATSDILDLGCRGFACRIDRNGKPWKYMVVTGTSNPHSIYELCFQIGERYDADGELAQDRAVQIAVAA